MNKDSEITPYSIENPEHLKSALMDAGLPIDKWGEGPTKTYLDLWNEIAEGESEMICPQTFEARSEYGEIIRQTNVLGIDVYAESDGKVYRLKEEKQVFNNGRGERKRELLTSLAEKIKLDENHEQAVLRAVEEELGVLNLDSLYKTDDVELWKTTPTYPELPSKLMIYCYAVIIADSDFDPSGYVEDQPTKQVFFTWDRLY